VDRGRRGGVRLHAHRGRGQTGAGGRRDGGVVAEVGAAGDDDVRGRGVQHAGVARDAHRLKRVTAAVQAKRAAAADGHGAVRTLIERDGREIGDDDVVRAGGSNERRRKRRVDRQGQRRELRADDRPLIDERVVVGAAAHHRRLIEVDRRRGYLVAGGRRDVAIERQRLLAEDRADRRVIDDEVRFRLQSAHMLSLQQRGFDEVAEFPMQMLRPAAVTHWIFVP